MQGLVGRRTHDPATRGRFAEQPFPVDHADRRAAHFAAFVDQLQTQTAQGLAPRVVNQFRNAGDLPGFDDRNLEPEGSARARLDDDLRRRGGQEGVRQAGGIHGQADRLAH